MMRIRRVQVVHCTLVTHAPQQSFVVVVVVVVVVMHSKVANLEKSVRYQIEESL